MCRLTLLLPPTFLALLMTGSAQASTPNYQIDHIQGDVYRFAADRHRSVFLLTQQGIVLTDPMNTAAAQWLQQELRRRFDVPVKYVIYSHNHSDHVYGGEVFKQAGAIFVSSQLAHEDLRVTRAKAVLPDISFQDSMRLSLGGHDVLLCYHGPNDGRGSISMFFETAKVLFVVDWIVLGRMPWRKLWSYDIDGMIRSTREVLALDFEVFVGGHGDVGDKDDVRSYLGYLESLYAAVIDGIHAGKSLAQLKGGIRLDRHRHLRHYEEWLPLNIEGVYERLQEESGMSWRSDID